MTDRDPHGRQPVLEAGAPLAEADAALLLLHGRGATAASILSLAQALERPRLAVLAPQAADVGYGPAWYPYSFLAPLAANEPWLSSALSLVGRAAAAIDDAGIPARRLILAGFSQGACLATEFAARNATRYGGIVALSGGLIGSEQIPGVDPPADKLFAYEGSLDGTPAFLGCSDVDPHIPAIRVEQTRDALAALGAEVDMRIYPGMGHTVNEDELEAFRAIVDGAASA
jgi:phospholipase/carboxylesterase